MNSKDKILGKIQDATKDWNEDSAQLNQMDLIQFDDPLAKAIEMVGVVGGEVIDRTAEKVSDQLQKLFPDQTLYFIDQFGPDGLDVQPVEVLVIQGSFIVAENGAVWYNSSQTARSMIFLAENLVILLDRNEVVHHMHEAYSRVATETFAYGTFISGPSKTADIEQALVIGAQGPRSMTLLIT